MDPLFAQELCELNNRQWVTGIKCLDFDDGIRDRAGKVSFEAKISAGNIKYMDLFLMGKGAIG